MVKTTSALEKSDHSGPDYVSHTELQVMLDLHAKQLADVMWVIAEQLGERLDQQDKTLHQHGKYFEQVQQEIGELKREVSYVSGKADAIIADIRELYDAVKSLRKDLRRKDASVAKLEKKVAKLEEWVKVVAAKAGLPEPKF